MKWNAGLLGGAAAVVYGAAALSGHLHVPAEDLTLDAARTMALTGTDPTGLVLPLFIHVRDTAWLQPLPVYLMALALKVTTGFSAAPRLVSASLATVDVVLTYLIARRVFRRERPAVTAAALLLLTPAHLVYGSTTVGALYSVPFVLLWLHQLFAFLDQRRHARLFAATFALGLGVYTNPEAVWTMAAYAALTLIVVLPRGRRPDRSLVWAAAGFAVPLVPLAPWFIAHPATYLDTMGRWGVHPANVRNPLEGLVTFFRYDVFAQRISLYWDFFSPRHLFFGGVFLWPLLLLLPLGLYHVTCREKRTPQTTAIVWGLALAPVAAVLFGERQSIGGALPVLPFAAILGAAGVELLISELARPHRLRSTTNAGSPLGSSITRA